MSWDDRRRARIAIAGGRCEICNATGDLQVHHRTYERFGEEWPQDLLALCPSCHGAITAALQKRPDWEGRPQPFMVGTWDGRYIRPTAPASEILGPISERGRRLIGEARRHGWRVTPYRLNGDVYEYVLSQDLWAVTVSPVGLGDVRIIGPGGLPSRKCYPLEGPIE